MAASGAEEEAGELELEASTLTASTGAATAAVVAGATGVEEVEKVVELDGELVVDGTSELQTEGRDSSMPSVMVEIGAPNWLTKTMTSGASVAWAYTVSTTVTTTSLLACLSWCAWRAPATFVSTRRVDASWGDLRCGCAMARLRSPKAATVKVVDFIFE